MEQFIRKLNVKFDKFYKHNPCWRPPMTIWIIPAHQQDSKFVKLAEGMPLDYYKPNFNNLPANVRTVKPLAHLGFKSAHFTNFSLMLNTLKNPCIISKDPWTAIS